MRAKRIVYFFIVLLLLSTFICSGDAASDTTVSFRGAGVTIKVTYPEEAHPLDSIAHDLTITANTNMILQNFTISIKAPVASGWQEIRKREEIGQNLSQNEPWQVPLSISLPQDVNGTLSCAIYILTNQTSEPLFYTFFTTHVSELTFSEMQSLYYEMLANYTTLKNDYDSLLVNYSSVLANYTELLSEHNQLTTDYNSKVSTYTSLLADYNKLSDEYDTLNANYGSKINEISALQVDYDDLNSTRNSLQTSLNTLQTIYDGLNQTYVNLQAEVARLQQRVNDSVSELNIDRIVMFIFTVAVACLIVFIVYLKRKKEEPYVVIRKETVSMKSDEES